MAARRDGIAQTGKSCRVCLAGTSVTKAEKQDIIVLSIHQKMSRLVCSLRYKKKYIVRDL